MKKQNGVRRLAVLLIVCMLVNCLTINMSASPAKAAGTTPTGLAVYTDLKWEPIEVENENGDMEERWLISGVNEDCQAENESGTNLNTATWYFVNGTNPVTADELQIQSEDGTVITDEETASLVASDEVQEGTEHADSYIRVQIRKTGDYRICLKEDPQKYITVGVQLPDIGFYTSQEASDDTFIWGDYTYTESNKTVYLIALCGEEQTLSFDAEKGISVDGDVVSGSDYSIEKVSANAKKAVYKVTISPSCQAELYLSAEVHIQAGEDEWDSGTDVWLRCASDGLVMQWPDYDDNGVLPADKDGDIMKSETIELGGTNLYFYTVSEQGMEQITNPEELKLFYYENGAFKDVTDNPEQYGSITQNEEESDEGAYHLFCVLLKKAGTYKVTTEAEPDNGVILKADYPDAGFYSSDSLSADNFLGGFYDYTQNRTIYLLKNPAARGEQPVNISGVEVVDREEMTDVYVTTTAVENGLRIDISPACTEGFELRVLGTNRWGDELWQTIYLAADDERVVETYADTWRRSAFSGCLISEFGYKTKNPWASAPSVMYWVHADSAQGVLDKLTAIGDTITVDGKEIAIKNTGYYAITMSYMDGDTVAAANQAKAQTIRPAATVKGILMSSGGDNSVAWATDTPNFSEDDFYEVVHITKNKTADQPEDISDAIWNNADYDDFYACNICNDEEDGWYIVTKAQNGVYVYNKEAKVPDAIIDLVYSEEYFENKAYEEDWDIWTNKYSWPEITIDATGAVPVVLDGKWKDTNKVTINYSKKTDFSVEVCGKTITKNDVATSVKVKDEAGNEVVVAFHCVDETPQATATPTRKPDPTATPPAKGKKVKDAKTGNQYKITNASGKKATVEYTAPKKGAKGTATVPDTVTIDGKTYKVTSISDNAFKNNKKLTKIVVGKNITGIGKNAFNGCKKLKTIVIKSTKLTSKGVKKGAFKGISQKTKVKVPKKCVKTYKKLFKQKGLNKKVKVQK